MLFGIPQFIMTGFLTTTQVVKKPVRNLFRLATTPFGNKLCRHNTGLPVLYLNDSWISANWLKKTFL